MGQASYVTDIYSWLKYSPDRGQRLPSPCSPSSSLQVAGVTPKGASARQTHLHLVALVPSGTYTSGSHRITANGERILNQPTLQGHSRKAEDWGTQCLCERGLLAYLQSCSWRVRLLLNTHQRADFNPLQRPWRVDSISALCFCCAPEGQSLPEGSLDTQLVPQFFWLLHPRGCSLITWAGHLIDHAFSTLHSKRHSVFPSASSIDVCWTGLTLHTKIMLAKQNVELDL